MRPADEDGARWPVLEAVVAAQRVPIPDDVKGNPDKRVAFAGETVKAAMRQNIFRGARIAAALPVMLGLAFAYLAVILYPAQVGTDNLRHAKRQKAVLFSDRLSRSGDQKIKDPEGFVEPFEAVWGVWAAVSTTAGVSVC